MILSIKKKLSPYKAIISLVLNYFYDLKRYYNSVYNTKNKSNYKNLEANLIKHYHVLEKGLSMPKVKKGFGQEVAMSLINLCEKYIGLGFDINNNQFLSSIYVLQKYISFNTKYCDLTEMTERYEKILKSININENQLEGGYKLISREDIQNVTNQGFREFSANRYSIRDYSEEDVDTKILIDSIKIAQKSPSACNRQASRVYIVENKELISKVLSYQNGNRGFGHLTNKLLIITSDIRVFEGVHERNQSFIDGGMFAMSLLYGLHYNGLGACALNWSTDYKRDLTFKKAIGINYNENILMMVSVGHLKESFKVAVSKRRNIDDIITII